MDGREKYTAIAVNAAYGTVPPACSGRQGGRSQKLHYCL